MLRKFSHIILSSLLLVSTIGMVVSKHYCSGSFVSASIFHEAESCCDSGDCCHNETQLYQVDKDFSQPQIINTTNMGGFDLFVVTPHSLLLDVVVEHNSNEFFIDFSPPPLDIQTYLSLKQTYLL